MLNIHPLKSKESFIKSLSLLYSIVCCPPLGYSTNFYMGRLRLRSNPLPFIYLFDRKGTPFAYLLFIDEWYPFHLPLLELGIPFNSCKCTVLKVWTNQKPRTFSWPFHSHKMHLYVVQTKIADFPTVSYTWSLKKVPLLGRASPHRPL